MEIIDEAVGIRKKCGERRNRELVNRGTQLEWLLEWKAEMNKGRLRVLNFT